MEEHAHPSPDEQVRFKKCGNICEIMWAEKNCKNPPPIKKLDKDHYVNLITGEEGEFQHAETRADNLKSVARSLANGRDLINANVTNPRHCRWVTLTYADNMTDTKKLFKDFENFVTRLRKKIGHFEYIYCAEPQGRGAWHIHAILKFDHNAPYISNNVPHIYDKSKTWKQNYRDIIKATADGDAVLFECWKQGFCSVKKLDDVDNVGAYLTAYLGDMDFDALGNLNDFELGFLEISEHVTKYGFKEIEIEQNGKKMTKKYIKGLRLRLYPVGFNIFRYSRGIKKPEIEYMTSKKAEKKVSAGTLTFEKTVHLTDETSNFDNIINYRYYNTSKKQTCQ